MLSDKSVKWFSYIVTVGNKTKLLPYVWNYERGTLDVVDDLRQRRIFIIFSILFRLVVYGTMCMTVLTNGANLSVPDYLYAAFVTAATIFGLVVELYHLVYTYESSISISWNILTAQRLAYHYNLSTKVTDGADALIAPFCVGFAIVIPCFWIVYILQVQLHFPLFALVHSHESIIWNILIGSAWGYKNFAIMTVVAFHLVECLLYVNSMTNLLKMCKYSPKSSKKDNYRMLIFYRTHQILHIAAEHISYSTNTASVLFSTVVQISFMYMLIKGVQIELSVILASILIITIVATRALLGLAADYTDASLEYPNSIRTSIFKPKSVIHDRVKLRREYKLRKIYG